MPVLGCRIGAHGSTLGSVAVGMAVPSSSCHGGGCSTPMCHLAAPSMVGLRRGLKCSQVRGSQLWGRGGLPGVLSAAWSRDSTGIRWTGRGRDWDRAGTGAKKRGRDKDKDSAGAGWAEKGQDRSAATARDLSMEGGQEGTLSIPRWAMSRNRGGMEGVTGRGGIRHEDCSELTQEQPWKGAEVLWVHGEGRLRAGC